MPWHQVSGWPVNTPPPACSPITLDSNAPATHHLTQQNSGFSVSAPPPPPPPSLFLRRTQAHGLSPPVLLSGRMSSHSTRDPGTTPTNSVMRRRPRVHVHVDIHVQQQHRPDSAYRMLRRPAEWRQRPGPGAAVGSHWLPREGGLLTRVFPRALPWGRKLIPS